MTTGRRIALLAAVVVIAVVGFIVLKPDDKKETSSKQPAATTATAPGTAANKGAKPAKPAPPPIPQVRVKNGKPAGGIKKIEVNKGDRVRFVVRSDVADHVHVHGYDFMKDVKAGGKASFSFPAKIDGVFEVELEDRGEQIAELTVNP
jgi:hypothetical protein